MHEGSFSDEALTKLNYACIKSKFAETQQTLRTYTCVAVGRSGTVSLGRLYTLRHFTVSAADKTNP